MARAGRILIVDDEVNARTALSELLRDEGFVVETSCDAFKGLGRFEVFAPDIVITDLRMPGMHGLELVTKLAALAERPAMVVITAYGTIDSAIEAMRAGADEYLIKPLDFKALLCALDRVLDVRERRRTAGNRRSVERLEAMQTLCAGLAHEVRNPLNSARLQLELAGRRVRRGADDEKLAEPIDLARVEIDRLTMLLDEFLAFATPRALDPSAQDIVDVVRGCVAEVLPRAEQRGANLTFEEHEAIVTEIDAGKIRQVVSALVGNALEAVSSGGKVGVAVGVADGHVHIRVTDDGCGIPADVLPRIYEPFFSTKDHGTGMGMSIAHSLVALHDGTIAVASAPGKTTFDVAIPRHTRPS